MRKLVTIAGGPKKSVGITDALYWLKTLLKSDWSANRSGGPITVEKGLVRLFSGGISSDYIQSSVPEIEDLISVYAPLANKGNIEKGSEEYKKLASFAKTLDKLVAKAKNSGAKKQIRLKDGTYLVNAVTLNKTKQSLTIIVDGSDVIYTSKSGLVRAKKSAFLQEFQSFRVSDTDSDPDFAIFLLKEAILRTKEI